MAKPIYYSELDIDDETLECLLREMPVEEDAVPFKYLLLTRKLRVYKPKKRYMSDTNDSSKVLDVMAFFFGILMYDYFKYLKVLDLSDSYILESLLEG